MAIRAFRPIPAAAGQFDVIEINRCRLRRLVFGRFGKARGYGWVRAALYAGEVRRFTPIGARPYRRRCVGAPAPLCAGGICAARLLRQGAYSASCRLFRIKGGLPGFMPGRVSRPPRIDSIHALISDFNPHMQCRVQGGEARQRRRSVAEAVKRGRGSEAQQGR